jgi:hypothetical protein
MHSITAEQSSSIKLSATLLNPSHANSAAKIAGDVVASAITAALTAARSELATPSPARPDWLSRVERRIRNSIATDESAFISDDGQWISATVALQAMSFFQRTFDLLPGEPYIYSSTKGDLVAEYRSRHASLTLIVGSTEIVGFARAGDDSRNMALDVRNTRGGDEATREAVSKLTAAISFQ